MVLGVGEQWLLPSRDHDLQLLMEMRHFGLDEANRLIPLLTRIFDTVRPSVRRLQEATSAFQALPDEADGRVKSALTKEIEQLFLEIRDSLEPLVEMGIEVKAADGLVDFRALLGGRTVYLCWRYGESSIAYWHELNAGYGDRRPIYGIPTFAPTYLS